MTWPAANACLNGASALLLVAGWVAVRARRIPLHKACMLGATAVSAAFLASYLAYHFARGSTRFPGTGGPRVVYLAILLSHTILALVALPLVLTTLWRAWRGQLDRHRRIARWTLPIWLYVSVTGVVVYWMLYRLYPAA